MSSGDVRDDLKARAQAWLANERQCTALNIRLITLEAACLQIIGNNPYGANHLNLAVALCRVGFEDDVRKIYGTPCPVLDERLAAETPTWLRGGRESVRNPTDVSVSMIHKTVPVWVIVDVDEGVADFVRYLQTIPDVRTFSSCQDVSDRQGRRRSYVGLCAITERAKRRIRAEFDVEEEGEWCWHVYPRTPAAPRDRTTTP